MVSEHSPFRTAKGLTVLLTGVCLTLAVLAVGASTFYAAKFSQVRQNLNAQLETAQAKGTAVDRLRAHLGLGGYLFHFNEYIRTGQPQSAAALRASLNSANAALQELETQPLYPAQAALAHDLRNVWNVYQNVTHAVETLQAPPTADFAAAQGQNLATALSMLDLRLSSFQRQSSLEATHDLEEITIHSRNVALMAAVGFMLLAVGGFWLIRSRILGPVEDLSHNLQALLHANAWRTPVWGHHRTDEVGLLARTIDTMRRQIASAPSSFELHPDGHKLSHLEARYAPLFERAISLLDQSAATLHDKAEGFEHLVHNAQDQLSSAVAHVGDTCSGVAQTSEDTQKVVRAAAGVLLDVMERLKSTGAEASQHIAEMTTTLAALHNTAQDMAASEQNFRNTALQAADSTHHLTSAAERIQHSEQAMADSVRTAAVRIHAASNQLSELIQHMRKSLLEANKATPESPANPSKVQAWPGPSRL